MWEAPTKFWRSKIWLWRKGVLPTKTLKLANLNHPTRNSSLRRLLYKPTTFWTHNHSSHSHFTSRSTLVLQVCVRFTPPVPHQKISQQLSRSNHQIVSRNIYTYIYLIKSPIPSLISPGSCNGFSRGFLSPFNYYLNYPLHHG